MDEEFFREFWAGSEFGGHQQHPRAGAAPFWVFLFFGEANPWSRNPAWNPHFPGMSPQLQRPFQARRIPVKPAAPTVPKAQNPSEPPGEVGFVREVSVGSSKLPKEWIRNSWECLGSARARPSSRPGVTSQKCRWKTGQATGRTGRAWIPPSPVPGRGELLPPSCAGGFIQVYPGFHGIRRDSAFL